MCVCGGGAGVNIYVQRSEFNTSQRIALYKNYLLLLCRSVGEASDRHAADAGSIPRCGKEFFSQSQLSVQTLLRCPYTPVCSRMH